MKKNTNTIPDKDIIFFFMPQSIVFFVDSKNDSQKMRIFKKMSPYFYWCSAHDFGENCTDNRYLFQHQVYLIECGETYDSEIEQSFFSTKEELRNALTDFLSDWIEHERMLLNVNYPRNINGDNESLKEDKNLILIDKNEYDFTNFANFVGSAIYETRKSYINMCQEGRFDLLRMNFWKEEYARHEKTIQDLQLKINDLESISVKKPKKNESINNNKRPGKSIHKRGAASK